MFSFIYTAIAKITCFLGYLKSGCQMYNWNLEQSKQEPVHNSVSADMAVVLKRACTSEAPGELLEI